MYSYLSWSTKPTVVLSYSKGDRSIRVSNELLKQIHLSFNLYVYTQYSQSRGLTVNLATFCSTWSFYILFKLIEFAKFTKIFGWLIFTFLLCLVADKII